MVWFGGTPLPPGFGKTPNFFRFFLMKAALISQFTEAEAYARKVMLKKSMDQTIGV